MENATETVEQGAEVAQVVAPKVELNLNSEQYLEIKALFNASSEDAGRTTLSHVYYQSSLDRFLACDGHVARILKGFSWDDEDGLNPKPNVDFTLRREDFLLTKGQLKVKPFQVIPTHTLDESEQGILNTLSNLLEIPEEYFGQSHIGMNPEILVQFCKTFVNLPKVLVFRFNRQNIQSVFVYGKLDKYGSDEVDFLGVIMPVRILGDQFPRKDWQPVVSEVDCQPRQAA